MNENSERQKKKWRSRTSGVAAATAAFAAAITLSSASPASADRIEYTYDVCSSNVGSCMGLFYYGPKNGVMQNACFLTNRSITDHWGRAEHGVTTRYEFRNQPGHAIIPFHLGVQIECWPEEAGGNGHELKNAAAAVANQDWVGHAVYYNSYYEGPFHHFPQDTYGSLNSAVRNNNASSWRETR